MDSAGTDLDGAFRARTRARVQSPPGVVTDVAAGLARLCEAGVQELRFRGAAVTLMTPAGADVVVAASDEATRLVEELHFQVGEGPRRDAFLGGRPVICSDLREDLTRWPGYVEAALGERVAAAYSFPLQLGAVRFGVLTFYNDRARELDTAEITQCLILAEVATDWLLDSSSGGSPGDPEIDLSGALVLRNEIYQAQGMVMVALGTDLAGALARMRARAYATDLDLAELAGRILRGETDLGAGVD